MSEQKLLPCPFCGNEAGLKEKPSKKGVRWSIGCITNGCHSSVDLDIYYFREEFAIKSWNTRYIKQEPKEIKCEYLVFEERKLPDLIKTVNVYIKHHGYKIQDSAVRTYNPITCESTYMQTLIKSK